MRQRIVFLICVVILGVTYPLLAGGQEPYREIQGAKKSTLDFHGWLKTYFIYKNDQDFDSKTPIFNEYGQSLGFFAVAFDPRITWQPHPQITVSYLADITGSLWSSTNVDPRLDQLQNQPVYLQKEFWTQVILPSNTYGFRVGFQYFEDPTRLFVKKYLGALRTFYRRDSSWLAFTVAQIPDTTYEGIDFSENNFENDNFVFALDGRLTTDTRLAFRPGLFFQWDRTVVDKTKFLVNPCLNLHGQLSEDLTFDIDLVLQTGQKIEVAIA